MLKKLADSVGILVSFAAIAMPSAASAHVQQRLTHLPENVRPVRLDWCQPEGLNERIRCGVYLAQENRLRPTRRQLPIKVVVLPAKGPGRLAPVFVFAGGPGEAATSYASELLSSGLRRDHDIVLVDQRGTAEGHRLDCPMSVGSGDVQEYVSDLFGRLEFWRECARRLSRIADLSQYSTPVAATDIDEIRQALGYDEIDVMGGSYGSRHAIVYAKMFPKHVHAAFLSGLVPLEVKSPLHHAEGAQRAFDLMVRDCRNDKVCKAAYPQLPADLAAVLRRLEREPPHVSISDPATHKKAEVVLNRNAFTEGLRRMLYSAPAARQIPALLRRAWNGDFAAITQRSADFGYEVRKGLNVAMGLSANCNEDTERVTPNEIERYAAHTFVGPTLVRTKLTVCQIWPDAWLPADHFARFKLDVPTIVLSGFYDPIAPPHWGDVARRHFPNSVHVVIPTGHSLGEETCTDTLAVQLFATGDPKRVDLSCTRTFSLPPFPVETKDGGRG